MQKYAYRYSDAYLGSDESMESIHRRRCQHRDMDERVLHNPILPIYTSPSLLHSKMPKEPILILTEYPTVDPKYQSQHRRFTLTHARDRAQ